jgi:hypothetical protein
MKTKLLVFAIIAVFAAMIVSCGQNKEDQKKKAIADSIKKVDSIANIFVGTWIEERYNPRKYYITKTGDIFTIKSDYTSSEAYKRDGQTLIKIDNSAGNSPWSLIEDGQLLYYGDKYAKEGSNKDLDAKKRNKVIKDSLQMDSIQRRSHYH